MRVSEQFASSELAGKGSDKVGKRGFRVYPNWTKTESSQAEKTKSWQSEYFINFNSEVESIRKFDAIFTSN